jgi:hypothetical protein
MKKLRKVIITNLMYLFAVLIPSSASTLERGIWIDPNPQKKEKS